MAVIGHRWRASPIRSPSRKLATMSLRQSFGTVVVLPYDPATPELATFRATRPDGSAQDFATTEHADTYADALAYLGLRRRYLLNPALSSVRDSWDSGDVWGSAMGILIHLCDVAYAIGADIAGSAGFSPSPFVAPGDLSGVRMEAEISGDSDLMDLLDSVERGEVTAHDLTLAIRAVSRYLDIPAVAERSY